MKNVFRALAGICTLLSAAVLWKIASVEQILPNELCLTPEQSLCLCGGEVSLCPLEEDGSARQARLWGVIPLSEIPTREVSRSHLVPCGQPFGIKLLTQGVVVTGTVRAGGGRSSPAEDAGVRPGDILLTVDGRTVSSAQDVSRELEGKGGKEVHIGLERGGRSLSISVCPQADENGGGSLGLLVRDSSAGIGTITWYDPSTGMFGGLGHGICDTDTGVLLPLGIGQAVEVKISGVHPARAGSPGELAGIFSSRTAMGKLTANLDCGVFGILDRAPSAEKALPVAFPQEVKTGPAQILSTLSGCEPRLYDIEIVRMDLSAPDTHRDMVIRITDPELLEATGGIVQGMGVRYNRDNTETTFRRLSVNARLPENRARKGGLPGKHTITVPGSGYTPFSRGCPAYDPVFLQGGSGSGDFCGGPLVPTGL